MQPRVILHVEVSADGRIDWIAANVDMGRYYGLASRWKEDATLAGSETILNPYEDVPAEDAAAFEALRSREKRAEDTRPLLVIPDSRGRVRTWHYLLQLQYWRDGVALCSRSTPKEHVDYLEARNIDRIVTGGERVDLRAALEELNARHGVETVRVDSGGVLNGVLLREGLVSEVSLLFEPVLVGGTTPRSFFRAPDLESPEGVVRLSPPRVEVFEDGVVWLRYDVVR